MAKRYLINIFLLIGIMIRMRKSPMIYVIMYGQIGLS